MDKIEKEIHKEIHEHDRIRWTHLKKIIVDKKRICSERIFRERLNAMIENKLVYRFQVGKGNVIYSTESGLEKSENSRLNYFTIFLKATLKNLQAFENKMHLMSDTEKSDFIVSLLKIILLLEWGFKETFDLTKNPFIKTQISLLNDLKSDITKLAQESKNNDIQQFVQQFIYSETVNSFIVFEDKLLEVKANRSKPKRKMGKIRRPSVVGKIPNL